MVRRADPGTRVAPAQQYPEWLWLKRAATDTHSFLTPSRPWDGDFFTCVSGLCLSES